MASDKIYLNNRIMGENPESYIPGKLHPVHLGDILNDQYCIFRKLGTGSQSTVWLAKDRRASKRRFVAIKIFRGDTSETELKLEKLLQPFAHPGKRHIELALDSFMVHGPNGHHFCKVLEPLGCSLSFVLERAFEGRAKLNEPHSWLGKAVDGDPWSAGFAKRACWQILLGLDYLHSQHIAHRDIQPANICVALEYDLSSLSENEIQRTVWAAENGEVVDSEQKGEAGRNQGTSPEGVFSADVLESNDDSPDEWEREFEEGKNFAEAQWSSFEQGDKLAEPFSSEWNKANFFNSRHDIELLRRRDGKPLKPDQINYTVAATPLSNAADLEKPFRLVLIDLGFACVFDECEQLPLRNASDFRPPELLLGIPATHKADIFSLGLLFWEIVMPRRLVETQFVSDDPERTYQKNRLLRDLAQRLGPVPATIRAQWRDADRFVNSDGNALDMQDQDEQAYQPGDFEYGDIWNQARIRKPLDMSNQEMEIFVDLVQKMLQWQPESRPSTRELIEHEWFKDL